MNLVNTFMFRHSLPTMFCVDCMRYIDSIVFIVIFTDLAISLNNGTGSQVTTVNNTVFITYPTYTTVLMVN